MLHKRKSEKPEDEAVEAAAETPEVPEAAPVEPPPPPKLPSLEEQMDEKHKEIAGRKRMLHKAEEELDALIAQHNRQSRR